MATILYNTARRRDLSKTTSRNSAAISSHGPASPTASMGSSGRIATAEGNPLEGVVVSLSGTQLRKSPTQMVIIGLKTSRRKVSIRSRRRERTLVLVARSFGRTVIKPTRYLPQLESRTRSIRSIHEYFVRQQYVDILGRDPDEAGFNYWSDRILSCGANMAV